MIPRLEAKRLLDEFIGRAEQTADGLHDVAAATLAESDLVLRGVENIEQKGRRYLLEGRVTVQRADPQTGVILAECRGDEGIYRMGYSPRRREWRCTCPAPRKCSHLIALRLIVRPLL